MTFLGKLFKNKAPQQVKARCPITKEPIDNGFGYLLTTAQVVTSQKYWDLVMTEPETLSYTVSHFRNDHNGTRMRSLIFDKYSSVEKPWMISDSCIALFENVDRNEAREQALMWWSNNGEFAPENSGSASNSLEPEDFQKVRDYAILEAGRARIQA